jgi:hypothetical protein
MRCLVIPVAAAGSSGDGPEDRLTALRSVLLRLGLSRFGPPPAEVQHRLGQITDVAVLEKLLERALTGCRWADLFVEG